MKKWKLELLVICVLLCCVSVVRAQEAKGGEKLSDTRTAVCVMVVSSDPDIFPLWEENINTLVLSTGVGMRAVKEVLGTDEYNVMDFINYHTNKRYSSDPGGGELMSISIPVTPTRTISSRTPTTRPTTSRTTTSRKPVTRTPSRPTSTTRTSRTTSAAPTSRTSTSRVPTRTVSTYATTSATQKLNNQQRVYMTVEVDLGGNGVPSAAVELLNAFVSNFTEALEGAFDDYQGSFDDQRKAAYNEASDAEVDVRQLQQKLRDLSGMHDLSQEVVRSDIRKIRTELEDTVMELHAIEGDVEAYSKQIAINENKLKEKMKTDTILKELDRIVEINRRKEQNLRSLISKGVASAADVSKASEEVARALIELARRKDELSKSLPGISTSSFTLKLATDAIRKTQIQHQIRVLELRLAESRELIEKADQYEIQILKLALAKRNLEDAIMWRDQMSRKVRRLVAPSVIVMGAE